MDGRAGRFVSLWVAPWMAAEVRSKTVQKRHCARSRSVIAYHRHPGESRDPGRRRLGTPTSHPHLSRHPGESRNPCRSVVFASVTHPKIKTDSSFRWNDGEVGC